MKTVLIVCTGNLCRSPMAAALLRQRLAGLGLDGQVQVTSAGTWARPGLPAAQIARSLLGERGIPLEGHLSQPVTEAMLDAADLVIVMEEAHRRYLFHLSMKHLRKVFLLSELSGGADDVHDPASGTREDHVRTLVLIEKLLDAGMPRILRELRLQAKAA